MTNPVRRRPNGVMARVPGGGELGATEFDAMFDRLSRFLESAAAVPSIARSAWVPLADMHETDEAYVIEAELPGLKREDIDVQLSERELCITGEYKEREREGMIRRATRRTGDFEYRILLPAAVKAEEIAASLTEGVLTVTAPKAQDAKPRHIEIQG